MICLGDKGLDLLDRRLRSFTLTGPRPGIPEPDLGNYMEWSGFGATVVSRDTEEKFVLCLFGRLNEAVEVSIFVENTSVKYLVFPLISATFGIFSDELLVRELLVRIFVKEFGI